MSVDLLVMACKFYDKWLQDIEMLDIIKIVIELCNFVLIMLFSPIHFQEIYSVFIKKTKKALTISHLFNT